MARPPAEQTKEICADGRYTEQFGSVAADQGPGAKAVRRCGPPRPTAREAPRNGGGVRSDMRELNAVGKEKVDDLRQAVRQQLLQRIKGPIRQRCKKFVAAHQDVGPGVKMRMLDLFDNLVPTVMETAKRTATNVLLSNFQAVETQIRDIFDQHQDPIERAAEAIVVSEKTSREREDAPRRDSVLQRIHEVTSTAPGPDNGNGATAA